MDIINFLGPGIIIFVMLSFGDTMLMMRTSMADTLFEEYVFAARAKGLPEKDIRDRHASPNALLPVLSRQIINVPILLSGMVMIEEALGTGGMGSLLFESLRNYDVPVVMGALLVIGVIALASRLLLEIATAYLDPRLRFVGNAQGSELGALGFSHQGCLSVLVPNFVSWFKSGKSQEKSMVATASWAGFTPSTVSSTQRNLLLRMRFRVFGRRLQENWRVFSENRLAVFGLILILIFIGMAFVQPVLMKTIWASQVYDPLTGFDPRVFPNPAPPTKGHLLGTDGMGRDVLSMLLEATSNTLMVAISSALIAAVIGTTVGAISAYFQGTALATFLGYLNDTLLVLPTPIVMVIIGTRFHDEVTPLIFGILFGVMAGCSYVAIIMRSQALMIMTKPFIQASIVAGAGPRRIIFTHLVPHLSAVGCSSDDVDRDRRGHCLRFHRLYWRYRAGSELGIDDLPGLPIFYRHAWQDSLDAAGCSCDSHLVVRCGVLHGIPRLARHCRAPLERNEFLEEKLTKNSITILSIVILFLTACAASETHPKESPAIEPPTMPPLSLIPTDTPTTKPPATSTPRPTVDLRTCAYTKDHSRL